MTKFTVEITCENSAFEDRGSQEVVDILRDLAGKIEDANRTRDLAVLDMKYGHQHLDATLQRALVVIEELHKLMFAEVRRLQAASKAAWKAAGDEMTWRMAVENDRDAKAKELTAVRAAVEEESKRADRAEAAARELRSCLGCFVRNATFVSTFGDVMERTAWLDGKGVPPDSDRALEAARLLRHHLHHNVKRTQRVVDILVATAWLTGGNES